MLDGNKQLLQMLINNTQKTLLRLGRVNDLFYYFRFSVMACCWAMNPEERPKFSQLLACLQDFYTALGRFI